MKPCAQCKKPTTNLESIHTDCLRAFLLPREFEMLSGTSNN